jgi:hypothetical protein
MASSSIIHVMLLALVGHVTLSEDRIEIVTGFRAIGSSRETMYKKKCNVTNDVSYKRANLNVFFSSYFRLHIYEKSKKKIV